MNTLNEEQSKDFESWIVAKTIRCPKCGLPHNLPTIDEVIVKEKYERFEIHGDTLHSPYEIYINLNLIRECPDCQNTYFITSYQIIKMFFKDFIFLHFREGKKMDVELEDGSSYRINPYLILTSKKENQFFLQREDFGINKTILLDDIVSVLLTSENYYYESKGFNYQEDKFYLNYSAR